MSTATTDTVSGHATEGPGRSAPADPDALTEAEVADRARLLARSHAALGREAEAMAEFGRALGQIQDRRLYRRDPETDRKVTFAEFVQAEYGHEANWAYERIDLAAVAGDPAGLGVGAIGAPALVEAVDALHASSAVSGDMRRKMRQRVVDLGSGGASEVDPAFELRAAVEAAATLSLSSVTGRA